MTVLADQGLAYEAGCIVGGHRADGVESQFANIAFVKFDIETEQPVRGPDGLCVKADVDEAGEALGLIGDDVRQRFEGYNDAKATEKKLLRDVFTKGDLWFRTGDLLKMDKDGYIYFVDRIGDTFRWKGENVSTNEVGEALSRVKGIKTANVYGVPIPGTRAVLRKSSFPSP